MDKVNEALEISFGLTWRPFPFADRHILKRDKTQRCRAERMRSMKN